MKRLFSFLLLCFFTTFWAQNATSKELQDSVDSLNDISASAASDVGSVEKILSFHSDITVNKDASVTVVETIVVNSLGEQIRRGISRTFPKERNLNGEKSKTSYDVLGVKCDGQRANYSTTYHTGSKTIYIGDEDVMLPNGKHTYEITYTVKKQVGFFAKYDELYWNVNGFDWSFPMDVVSATVHLPEGAKAFQNSCYTGAYGSKESNCTVNVVSDQQVEWEAKDLGTGSNLTVAVGFNKGVILPPPPPSALEKYGVAGFLAAAFLALLGYFYSTWRKYGVDPPKPTVIPQYNIPENMSPAQMGFLSKESFDTKFITASIVDLAIKGFVRIKETKESTIIGLFASKVFEVEKLKEPDQSISKEEIGLMNDLFKSSPVVKFSGKYSKTIETMANNYESNVNLQYSKLLKEGNNRKFLILPSLAILVLFVVGMFISTYLTDTFEYFFVSMIFLVFVVVIGVIILLAMNKIKKNGCAIAFGILFVLPTLVGIVGFFIAGDLDINSKACFGFLIAGIAILFLYSYLIKRPSEEKLRQQSLIEGFKMYMGAAENEQIKFFNPPTMTPEIFEKFLPYAMVMGVDKIWGQKFDNLLAQSAQAYENTWYIGTPMGFGSFGHSFSNGMTNAIQNGVTPPSSSFGGSGGGSSFSSGSGGGGFSGGGGGGGGGGGW